MSGLPLNVDPLNLSPEWFNQLFEISGIPAKVSSLTAKSIGTGQIGENIRFNLNYERKCTSAPDTLVGKFPSDNEASLATAQLLGHYEREVMFYRAFPALAARIAPAPLYAEHDKATNRFVLMMQDMAPAEQGDQLAGCSFEEAQLAMKAAAILHAAHWNDPEIDKIEWLQGTSVAPPPAISPEQVAQLWEGFKLRYADKVSDDMRRVGDAYAAALPAWSDGYEGPFALTHNDFRLDNMLFGKEGAAKPLAVVDWQTCGKGGPASDVSYFIGAGLTREDRPKYEKHLLKHYLDCLHHEGVTNYSFEDLLRDYKWFSFYGMSVAFGAAMLVEQTDRGDKMFLTMMRRHVGQALENDALSLLP